MELFDHDYRQSKGHREAKVEVACQLRWAASGRQIRVITAEADLREILEGNCSEGGVALFASAVIAYACGDVRSPI